MIGLAADSGEWGWGHGGAAAGTPGAGAARGAHARPQFPHALFLSHLSLSGCGKSTFMRRMTSVFGGAPAPPAGE
jgi:hypothetical protein